MSNLFTIAVTIFDVIWLSAVFVLLWLIWRTSTTHARNLEKTLIDVSRTDAESARRASEAAQMAVEMIKKDRT